MLMLLASNETRGREKFEAHRLVLQDDEDAPKHDRKIARRDTEFRLSLHQHASEKIATDTRQKGPCSYESCPNPHHSSGGGFKVVTSETKAGNRDWSAYAGRVFCNACFTQYATRGTFQRPGRVNSIPHQHTAAPSAQVHTPATPDTCDQSRSRSFSPPLAQPAVVDIPTVIEDGMHGDEEAGGVVLMLELVCDGKNVQYQWLRNGKPIPGATQSTLVIKNPGQCHGEINCKVRNEYGQAPLFTSVQLPISLTDARQRYAPRDASIIPEAAAYQFTCVCGCTRQGSPSELVEACQCGLELCGTVEPVYDTDGSLGTRS
jgi:hypothetical protein